MTHFPPTDRTRLRRLPERALYDQETVYAILDAALICHVAFVQEGQPFVIPTLHARDGDRLLLHGASSSRLMRHLQAGHEACIAVTIVDGIVLARSVFEHSINYRSAVLFAAGQPISEEAEKRHALQLFTEKLLPGRWQDARQPTANELKATGVVAFPIESATAKVRTGPPEDLAEDLHLPVWAGVLPLYLTYGQPQPTPDLPADLPFPDYLQELVERPGS
jgi:nitroimidazol reductase NimA-like FMN-containing flavoprotein (pyridoxamine 5'-phosphate oxidase superfamily)